MFIRLCIFVNLLISIISISQVVLRMFDGLHMYNKFFAQGFEGIDIGAYSTLFYFNICFIGCVFSLYYLNRALLINSVTLFLYSSSLILIDISLLCGLFYLTDVR